MARSRTALALLTAAATTAGCSALAKEPTISAQAARTTLGSQLQLPLAETPPVSGAPNLHNVVGTYWARTAHERVLLVVFDTSAATVQLTGTPPPQSGLAVARNVVVVYDHDAGTHSRLSQLKGILRGLTDRAA